MATRIVSLLAKINLDGSGFQQGVRKVGHEMDKLGYSAGTLQHMLAGAFSFYALERAAHHVVSAVSRFKNLAEQMNISTDEAQTFDAAAMHSGQTLEDLAGPLNKLAAARKSAAEGDEDLRQTFQRLGISLADLQNPMLRNIDLMKLIAENIQHINFTAREAAEFRELFGKSGQKIAAVFRDLENVHIDPISEDTIAKIHEFHHAIEMIQVKLTALAAESVNLKWFDFIPGPFRESNNAPPMSKDDVAAENARKHFKAQEAFEAGPEGDLFKDKAKEKETAKLKKALAEQEVKLNEKIFELQLKGMSVSQRRATLERGIAEHMQKAQFLKDNGFAEDANEELLKALELRTQLENLKDTGKPHDFHLSQFEQIGAQSGITTGRAFALAQPASANDQKSIVRNTGETTQILRNLDRKIKEGGTSSSFF